MGKATDYTIDNVTPRTTLDRSGSFREVFEVYFTTRSGVRDVVKVDADEYTPENVQARIAERAALHEQVMDL